MVADTNTQVGLYLEQVFGSSVPICYKNMLDSVKGTRSVEIYSSFQGNKNIILVFRGLLTTEILCAHRNTCAKLSTVHTVDMHWTDVALKSIFHYS